MAAWEGIPPQCRPWSAESLTTDPPSHVWSHGQHTMMVGHCGSQLSWLTTLTFPRGSGVRCIVPVAAMEKARDLRAGPARGARCGVGHHSISDSGLPSSGVAR